MKKLKEKLKRGLAMMMAAAAIVSSLPSMSVLAASETAKITFQHCHDAAGNTIRYQQTVTHDGRTCSEAGEIRSRIYADGEPAFCIQPGVPLHTGNTLQANASDAWNALSSSQRNAVNLALLYGSQGSMGSLSGSEDEKMVATQIVIWEIVSGCRSANAPYNRTDSKFYDCLCANGANSGVSTAYSQIVAGMQEHGTIPSFASTDRSAVVKELVWDGNNYVLNLTDTNGVLSKYHFTSSDSSVSVSASGNTLTITSANAVTGDVLLSATKKSPTVSSTLAQEEQKYTYRQSMQIQGQTGSIGYLRGDFGSRGNEFHTTWNDHREPLKTEDFQAELDEVIGALRSEQYGLLVSRSKMSGYAGKFPDSTFSGNCGMEYGFRVDTEKHAYLIRCNPAKGDYNFYCFCYISKWLDSHMEKARQGIRFIDPHYKELFRIPDGGKILITSGWGQKNERVCRFIDEYHSEIGSNLYHICEFAERMEQNGATYEPVQAEPQKTKNKER